MLLKFERFPGFKKLIVSPYYFNLFVLNDFTIKFPVAR